MPSLCRKVHRYASSAFLCLGLTLFWTVGVSQVYIAIAQDPNAPLIVSIDPVCDHTNLLVAFSQPLHPVSSLDTRRYELTGGRDPISVEGVAFVENDPTRLILHLEVPLSADLSYTLLASVEDPAGIKGSSSIDFRCNRCKGGSAGTEFWLTFPGNYAVNPLDDPAPRLFIAGQPGTTGNVSSPGFRFLFTFSIPTEGVATINLPREADLASANDVIEDKGIRVIASQPVTVFGYNYMPQSTDGYLALPVSTLGQAYLFMSYQNLLTAASDLNGVQLAVVATADQTTVTIIPSADIGPYPAKIPFTRVLDRGQTFQLLNTDATPVDLTGTLIFADQPIAAFASHQCASVPSTNDLIFCNHLVEQLPPTHLWSTEFLTAPLATRLGGDTFRCLALSDNTTITVNGDPVPGVLAGGQFHELRLEEPAHITADHPILLAQFANSSDFDSVSNADPFMVFVPPTSLFGSEYIVYSPFGVPPPGPQGFALPPSGGPTNYLSIVAPSDSEVLLDGVSIDTGGASPVGDSGYSALSVPVTPGPHTLSSPKDLPFTVIAYGWNAYDAYGYPAGLCQVAPREPPVCDCPPSELDLPIDSNCVARVPDLRDFLTNCYFFFMQDPEPGGVLTSGTHLITTSFFDLLGNRHDCVTAVNGSGPRLTDIVTNCVTPAGTVVSYTPPACGTNQYVCNPPSGSLFPPGVTTVTCVQVNQPGGEPSFRITVRCLTISFQAPNTTVVTWTGGGVLESAPQVSGPWQVLDVVSPFSSQINPVERQRFYRVRYR